MFNKKRGVQNMVILLIVFLILATTVVTASATPEKGKRALTHQDYDAWKIIQGSKISVNGQWVLYLETPQDGDVYLMVKKVYGSQVYRHLLGHFGQGREANKGAKAEFNYSTSHVAFLISQTKGEVEKAKKDKKKKKKKSVKKLGIMDLSTGKVEVIDRVKGFKLAKEGGNWLTYLHEEPEEKKKDQKEKKKIEKEKKADKKEAKKDKKKKFGTELILYALKDGQKRSFTDVLEYWLTKKENYLVFTVSGKKKPAKDGVYGFNLKQNIETALLTGEGNYKKLAVNKEQTVLAFITDRDTYQSDKPKFYLYGWKFGDNKASLWVSHRTTAGFPKGMAVSDKSNLTFSKDGKMVMFGIKEIAKEKKKGSEEEQKATFDLWHWNDPYPQPQQKIMAKNVRNNTWESVYHIRNKRFVKLADPQVPDVTLAEIGGIAFANNPWPYTKRVSYYGRFVDVYIIHPKTGKRELVKKELYGRARLSPNGKYLFWFVDKDWFVYDITRKKHFNITKNLNVSFDRHDWDTPNPSRSYGFVGWTDNDTSLLINDRYDIWEIKPNGTGARSITEGWGRKNNISFRYLSLDPEETSINPKNKMLLRATNQDTMASGFFTDRVRGEEQPVKLVMVDRKFNRPVKARQADVVLYTQSSFTEYPDLWVSGIDFKKPARLTDLGKQMDEFLWGSEELIPFLSADGKPLKGILIKPDNFDANKKYPLMVYIYETLHNYLTHRFRHPTPGSSINPSYYVSNGYVLWMPDIEYDTGYPGQDALKCVLPGIQMLIRRGFVNPKAIGIQGHSWGGYQIAYMITQTNVFAAAEAGAPVSNMVSAYGGIRWGSGMVRQFQYERTQSRLGDTLWRVPLRYIENSPVFWADKVNTPLLMLHNDKDGAVPWYQGIEYMMALRRLEKEAYMFNYNGEAHGLRKRINQMDWTRRLAEFFDHHLKGSPAPKWMKQGIKAWEKEEKKK